jgi:Neurotransmitter-gated ion-channel transmembrane region.
LKNYVFPGTNVTGVTILLSLSVFSLMIADALPQTSEAIPLLG